MTKPLLLVLTVLTALTAPTFAQGQSESETMGKYFKKFNRHSQDFIDLAKASLQTSDAEIAKDLQSTASKWADHCDFLEEEFLILTIINDEDKTRVSSLVRVRITHEFKSIDFSIESVNLALGNLKKPGIVTQASKLKEDLRDFKDTLQQLGEKYHWKENP